MNLHTVILLGPPGSGKGTQADRLADYFRTETDENVLHFETGSWFRKLSDQSGYTSRQINESLNSGDLQPSFLAAHFWTNEFIQRLDAETHLVIDGSPRRMLEAKIMNEALEFYQRDEPVIAHLDITRKEAFARLSERGRGDDTKDGIKRRLQQFADHTQPVVEYYRNLDGFRYERIDGKQSVNAVAADLRSVINKPHDG